jgi:outer membrane immunogenic protein
MRKAAIGIAATAVLLATPALAADLGRPYYKAPPPPPPPVFSWTGCYIGADVGGGWVRDEDNQTITGTGAPSPFSSAPTNIGNPSGVKAGGYAGCDYQFAGGFVMGVLGDAQWADISGDNVIFPGSEPAGTPQDYYTTKADFEASLRGRIGYAFNRVLVYATGGAAWLRVKEADFIGGVSCVAAITCEEHSSTLDGWTVGGGVDYAFTDYLIARIEYRYSDFGTFSYDSGIFPGFTENHKITENQVLGGLHFKFGGFGAPVATRY